MSASDVAAARTARQRVAVAVGAVGRLLRRLAALLLLRWLVRWTRALVARTRRAVATRRSARLGTPVSEPLASLLAPAEVLALRLSDPSAVVRAEHVCLDAIERLQPADRAWLDARVTTLLRGAVVLPDDERRTALEAAASSLEARLAAVVDQDARRRYTGGLLNAVALSLVLLAIVWGLAVVVVDLFRDGRFGGATLTDAERYAVRDVLVGVGGGAAGAVVSVLLRLSHTDRLSSLVASWGRVAVFRVALGWFFSAALIFALKGGLLDVVSLPETEEGVPEELIESWFFWGAVGFLGGFNERWVKHLFTRDPETHGREPSTDGEPQGAAPRAG